jgi:hypothetical protein
VTVRSVTVRPFGLDDRCGSTSLDELMPDHLASVVVDGFQFDNAADYSAGLQLLDRTMGFRPQGGERHVPAVGVVQRRLQPWQSGDYPSQSGQVLQCLRTAGKPAYVWTIPSRLAFIEAVDTDAADQYSGLQNWFVTDAQP